jgi:hypothetical protein
MTSPTIKSTRSRMDVFFTSDFWHICQVNQSPYTTSRSRFRQACAAPEAPSCVAFETLDAAWSHPTSI